MLKDFDAWNDDKKKLDRTRSNPDFHEREIWWCAIGVNVVLSASVVVEGISNDVLIGQIRAFDRRRLYRKIGMISEFDFSRIKDCIVETIQKRPRLTAGSRRPKPQCAK